MFLAPWSRSRSHSKKIPGAGAAREKNQEPEPLEKKSGAGAGAAKKFAGSPALVTGYNLVSFLHNFMENISVLTKRNVLFNNEL